MTQMYGHRFTSVWGNEDLGAWQTIIFSFATFIVTEALCFLLNKDHPFLEFPPNPMQFRKLCESIKSEHTPRKTSKLTAPCRICGKMGKDVIKPDSKQTEVLCYDHFFELYYPQPADWWNKFLEKWTLDKNKIRERLKSKGFTEEDDIDRKVEELFIYHTLKVNGVIEGAKRQKFIYENG